MPQGRWPIPLLVPSTASAASYTSFLHATEPLISICAMTPLTECNCQPQFTLHRCLYNRLGQPCTTGLANLVQLPEWLTGLCYLLHLQSICYVKYADNIVFACVLDLCLRPSKTLQTWVMHSLHSVSTGQVARTDRLCPAGLCPQQAQRSGCTPPSPSCTHSPQAHPVPASTTSPNNQTMQTHSSGTESAEAI